jgi:hypothetical protein
MVYDLLLNQEDGISGKHAENEMRMKYCFYKYRSSSVSIVFTEYRLPEHRLLLSPHVIHAEILEVVHEQ